MVIPPLWQHFCDDAAIFPPGNVPLPQAVLDHERRRASGRAGMVGPLVLSAAVLPELDPLLAGQPDGSLPVAVTVPTADRVADTLDQLAARPAVHLRMVEVALGDDDPAAAVESIRHALDGSSVEVAVEVPRDGRRTDTLDLLGERAAAAGWIAKFRTGGVEAEMYPPAAELAEAVIGCVVRDLPFKCTAGLHHAVRHVDPDTGFDEHGFGNLLLATSRALLGAHVEDLVPILDERDGEVIAGGLAALEPDRVTRLRAQFRSFGTCSIDEPFADLVRLGLLDPDAAPTGVDPLHPDDLLHADTAPQPDDPDSRRAS